MHADFYSKKLYPLQDKALKIVAKESRSFYLTGGTALSRVFLHHRYSDDLDFLNSHPKFKGETSAAVKALKDSFPKVEIVLSDDSFLRLFVIEKGVSLKVEFINDVKFRVGKPGKSKLFPRTDSWKNMLSNKISALSRNEEKDIADLLYFGMKYKFNWPEVIGHAKEKDLWVNELEISKIIFDLDISRLEKVKWIHMPDYKVVEIRKLQMARDIVSGNTNQP